MYFIYAVISDKTDSLVWLWYLEINNLRGLHSVWDFPSSSRSRTLFFNACLKDHFSRSLISFWQMLSICRHKKTHMKILRSLKSSYLFYKVELRLYNELNNPMYEIMYFVYEIILNKEKLSFGYVPISMPFFFSES